MEKSYVLTLSVAIDLPEGATLNGSTVTLPDGRTLIPTLALGLSKPGERYEFIADYDEIEERVGGMEYLRTELREMMPYDEI
jgi:hypothetical protein